MPSYWWSQETPIGKITCLAGSRGLRAIQLPGSVSIGALVSDASHGIATDIASELDEYFSGERRQFEVSLDLSNIRAQFHQSVLEKLYKSVPFGETVTYGELAAMCDSPRAARAVGEAMRRNPVPIVIPCHRVVASNGLGGYMGRNGLETKRWLLTHEGISSFATSAA